MAWVLYLQYMKISPNTSHPLPGKKDRAWCSLWTLWGFTVWMGAPRVLPLLLNGKFNFMVWRWVAASLKKLVGLAGHGVQRPCFLVVAEAWPWLPACSPIWSCLGTFCCLLVLHFVDCFCFIESFACFYLAFTFDSQLLTLAKQPAQFQGNRSAGVDLGMGLTTTGPGEGQPGVWHPGTPQRAERARRKQASLGLAISYS